MQTNMSWYVHACRYTIFINIAVQGSSNKAWHIAQGPLSVVFGFGLGAIAAFCCSATRLWNNKYKRVLALVISGGCLPCMHVRHHYNISRATAQMSVHAQTLCSER
jgi:peptidoglycan/LPS O-acetylase OafA/YrhL